MVEMTKAELDESIQRISALWTNEVVDSGHENAASAASADLMSESGLLYVPREVLTMLEQAIEVGYTTALKHVQGGRHDDDLRQWRPELLEE